jgi:hypothetical protein
MAANLSPVDQQSRWQGRTVDIYTVYVDLNEGASPDGYDTLKHLMWKEFRVRPITPVGEIPVYFSPLFSPLSLIPLREHIERRIKESMKPDHSIVEVIEMKPGVVE